MKKYLIFLVLILSHFSIQAEGVKLICGPEKPSCNNCPEYQTLFPVDKFSSESGSLDIDADQSEILSNQNYSLSGDVKVKSDEFILAADTVEVNASTERTIATGNVKFQDGDFLIAGDTLVADRDEDKNLLATITNANYQDYGSGLNGANGISEVVKKETNIVILQNATYSLCPINENDWLIKADRMVLDTKKNRGIADNAIVKFYGVPIFYLPKYSWVLSGRGSGFLTPDYSNYREPGKEVRDYRLRVPYYFNIAPDRDLLVALTYMSSRRFIYEGKYRQLIAPKLNPEGLDSMWELEAQYLPKDEMDPGLKRWLFDFSEELDINNYLHFSARYNRVSDKDFFKDIAQTNTNETTLDSYLKLNYLDEDESFGASLLSEGEQAVNAGTTGYTRALEGTVSKVILTDTILPVGINLKSSKFVNELASKESGVRNYAEVGVSYSLPISFPLISPSASIGTTHYSLKSSTSITRTIAGAGLEIDFSTTRQNSLFGYRVNNTLIPKITYKYRAKSVQGNIPIFDSEDKYADIITFSDLTSDERYTGLDRITNANDITLSLESSTRNINSVEDDKDLLNMKIAQSFYADDEVVSDTVNMNYEYRRTYSDIVASIDVAVKKFVFHTDAQFDPLLFKIIKRENKISYSPSARKFISLSYSDDGTTTIGKAYGSYPLTDSLHIFYGIDKVTSSGVKNNETTGIGYENCCWAFRVAHFKDDNTDIGKGYNYSTGFELVLTGLGSTSTPLKGRIESNVKGYSANLR